MPAQARGFAAMETPDDFMGLDPMTGRYLSFQNKASWLNYLLMLDRCQMAAQEEKAVYENPWYLAALQNRLGQETR